MLLLITFHILLFMVSEISNSQYSIEPLGQQHKEKFIQFTDKYIGVNYFNTNNFDRQILLSKYKNLNASLVLFDLKKNIIAIRLTYAPIQWNKFIASKYLDALNTPLARVGYFKSLFIHPEHQGKGLGPALSQKSIDILKKMNCTHVVSHSWKESPNSSSVRYLEKYGFQTLGEIKNFWSQIDYLCTGCNKVQCDCTAVEMILQISSSK